MEKMHTALALAISCCLATPVLLSAQTAIPSAIEAASLKPQSDPLTFDRPIGCRPIDPSLFECRQATLRVMLMAAYGLKPYQIKGPGWIVSERYNLIARIQQDASDSQISTALQSLLTERFKMALHKEAEQLPGYELTVGKNGPKLKEVDLAEVAAAAAARAAGPGANSPTQAASAGAAVRRGGMPPIGTIAASMGADGGQKVRGKMQIPQIINMLTNQLGRPVVDMTGLKGTYEIDLTYAADESDPVQAQLRAALAADPRVASPLPPVDADGRLPTLSQAVKQTLGLDITAKQLPIEVLVIDRAEKVPVEN